jgi:hypothetical protein
MIARSLLILTLMVGALSASACGGGGGDGDGDGGGPALPSKCYNKSCGGPGGDSPDSGACSNGDVCTGISGCCLGAACSAPADFVCCPASGC